jgi:signal transduction histidine kinase
MARFRNIILILGLSGTFFALGFIGYFAFFKVDKEIRELETSTNTFFQAQFQSIAKDLDEIKEEIEYREDLHKKQLTLDAQNRIAEIPTSHRFYRRLHRGDQKAAEKYMRDLVPLDRDPCKITEPCYKNFLDLMRKVALPPLQAFIHWRFLLKFKDQMSPKEQKSFIEEFKQSFAKDLAHWGTPFSFHALELELSMSTADEEKQKVLSTYLSRYLKHAPDLLVSLHPIQIISYLDRLRSHANSAHMDETSIHAMIEEILPYFVIRKKIFGIKIELGERVFYHQVYNNQLHVFIAIRKDENIQVFQIHMERLAQVIDDSRTKYGLEFPVKLASAHTEQRFQNVASTLFANGTLMLYGTPHNLEKTKGRLYRQKILAFLVLSTIAGLVLLITLVLIQHNRATQRLSQAKSEFVSTVSHELKTPITAIRMFTEMIDSKLITDPDKTKQYYRSILCECDRLSRMITNLLSYAKIERGTLHLEKTPVYLNEVIDGALDVLSVALINKEFNVRRETENLQDYQIMGDKDLLIQAVLNVLTNSMKYSKDRRQIAIEGEVKEQKIRVRFSDQGIGISPKELNKIFDSFYRVQQEGEAGIVPGSGIGLYLVKNHVEAMGGSVTVSSELGKGTAVEFVFPMKEIQT